MKIKNDNSLKQKKQPFSASDIVFNKGTDTHLIPGNTVNQITIEPSIRSAFFKERPHLLNLLLRGMHNPIVTDVNETGEVPGEFYITPEATALIIEHLFRQNKNRRIPEGEQFNTKNIFVVDNDFDQVEKILAGLAIKENEDAKIAHVNGIHGTILYIRRIKNTMRFFIFDSEPSYDRHWLESVQKIFPSAKGMEMPIALQKDYYSCFTFVLKALGYFVKHGHEFFPIMEKEMTDAENACVPIPLEKLPPKLLKLYQGNSVLPETTLTTIVSRKEQLTLQQYYKKYAFERNDKTTLNGAALLKKYHYLDLLSQYLVKQGTPIERGTNLPGSLQKRIQSLSEVRTINKNIREIHVVDKYLTIKQILDKQNHILTAHEQGLIGSVDISVSDVPRLDRGIQLDLILHSKTALYSKSLDPAVKPRDVALQKMNCQQTLASIESKFPNFKEIYNDYTNKNIDNSDNQRNTVTLLVVAALAEIQDIIHLKNYLKYADKLLKLFKEYSYIIEYFRKHVSLDAKQPIHDLCLFELEDDFTDKYDFWVKVILEHGPEATKYLGNATAIANLICSPWTSYSGKQAKEENKDMLPFIREVATWIRYPGGSEHAELAKLCLNLNLSQKVFDKCKTIVATQLKSFDFLPDIRVSGKEIDNKLETYNFEKLKIGSLHGFVLGEYTACCQSIGKIGEPCVISGMTSAYTSFYVVLHNNKIIAQSWVWIGENGEVVFDSWEYINKHQGHMYKEFLLKAAEQFIEYGFSRVLIGTGGKTPEMGLIKTVNTAKPLIDEAYTDAKNQCLLKDGSALQAYQIFANKHASWLNSDLDNDTILQHISNSIASGMLAFEHFINLIRFVRMYRPNSLFIKSAAHKSLIQTAIVAYGALVNPLLEIKDEKNTSILDVIIVYNDCDLLNSILKQASNSKFLIEKILHYAVANNAVEMLGFFYPVFTGMKHASGFAGIKSDKYPSLLFSAVKNKSKECVSFILASINSERELSKLIEAKDTSGATILNYLAKNNDTDRYKELIKKCGSESYRFLRDKEQRGTILLHALFYNALEFCEAFKQDCTLYPLEPNLILRLLKQTDCTIKLETLNWIRGLFPNEREWLAYLQGSDDVILYVLSEGHYKLAIHLLGYVSDFNNLHSSLLDKKYLCSSKLFDENQRKELSEFLEFILNKYEEHPQQLKKLFSTFSREFIRAVARTQQLDLFERMLKHTDWVHGNGTILNAMMEGFYVNEKGMKRAPSETIKSFINALFLRVSSSAKHQLVIGIDYRYCSADVFEHLLERSEIAQCNQSLSLWLRFEKTSLINEIFEKKDIRDIKVLQLIFITIMKHHSEQKIRKYIKEQAHKENIYTNPFLLRVVYPLFEVGDNLLAELVHKKLECALTDHFKIYSNYRRSSKRWIKDGGPEKIMQDNLGVLIWDFLLSVMVQSHRASSYLQTTVEVSHKMIKAFYANNPDALSLFKLENPVDLAMISLYLQQNQLQISGVIDCFKLILSHCAPNERVELLNTYAKKLPDPNKHIIIDALKTFVVALDKATLLLELKSEVNALTETQKQEGKTHQISPEQKQVSQILPSFTPNQLWYFKCEYLWIFISPEEIEAAWEDTFKIVQDSMSECSKSSNKPSQLAQIKSTYRMKMLEYCIQDILHKNNWPALLQEAASDSTASLKRTLDLLTEDLRLIAVNPTDREREIAIIVPGWLKAISNRIDEKYFSGLIKSLLRVATSNEGLEKLAAYMKTSFAPQYVRIRTLFKKHREQCDNRFYSDPIVKKFKNEFLATNTFSEAKAVVSDFLSDSSNQSHSLANELKEICQWSQTPWVEAESVKNQP